MSSLQPPSPQASVDPGREDPDTRLVGEYVQLLDECYAIELAYHKLSTDNGDEDRNTSAESDRVSERYQEFQSALNSFEQAFGSAEFKAVWQHL